MSMRDRGTLGGVYSVAGDITIRGRSWVCLAQAVEGIHHPVVRRLVELAKQAHHRLEVGKSRFIRVVF